MKIFIPLFSILFFALSGCSEQTSSPPDTRARPAKLYDIRADSRLEAVRLAATIEATESSVLTFQVPGRLDRIEVMEGDDVEKGELLASLDQRAFQNAVSSAKAEFTRAENDYQRAEELLEEQAIAQSTVETRLAQRDAARATLDNARKDLEDSSLVAPFSGVVADISMNIFETVGPGQPVLTLQGDRALEAIVQVPASIVILSEQVTAEEIRLELDAAPGVLIEAALSEASAIADPGTQSFAARFRFDQPEGLLVLPGMTGTLSGLLPIRGVASANQLFIPIGAVISQGDETFVWVVDLESMKVSRRVVVVEVGPGDSVLITEGLNIGETIVSASGQYLYDGATVRRYAP